MSVYTENFETIFGVKNNIQALRNKVLELAIQGKLVEQDPNDEPASELVKKIHMERDKLVKEGKIKKQKPFGLIEEDEIPFQIPINWEWVRFGDIVNKLTDGTHSTPKYLDKGIPFLSVKDMSSGFIDFSNTKFISESEHNELFKRCDPEKGDLLITKIGTTGIPVVVDTEREFSLFVSVALVKFNHELLNANFLKNLVKTPYVKKLSQDNTKGIGNKNLVLKDLALFVVPIPPLGEQCRIVQKIEFLMAEIDKLEESLQKKEHLMELLPKAVVDAIGKCQTGKELKEQLRLVIENFGTIFQTPDSMQELRNVILQLAIEGKLVPQDQSEEPASELLKRIRIEKDKLVKEGKIKKQQPLEPIEEEEIPFEIPESWEWVEMDEVCYNITSGSTPPQNIFRKDGGIPFLKVYNIRNQKVDFKYKPQFIDTEYHNSKLKRSVLYPGDVIMNIVGPPLGKVAIIPNEYLEYNCNQAIVFFRPIFKELNEYLYLFLLSGVFLDNIELIGTAGQDNISITKSRAIQIPLPPFNEQRRIIERVNSIIILIDQMEKKLKKKVELVDKMVNM